MKLFIFLGLMLLGFSMIVMPAVFAVEKNNWSESMLMIEPENTLKKCRYFREKSMLTCNCHNLNFEYIPSTLRSEIEVLDFSVNRMVSIKKDTLSRFTNLKYLDLHDNFLRFIEEGAFEPLKDLIVLDLTKTLTDYLPKELFTLPHLERLFLENNLLTDSIFKNEVSSPLTIIQAANNKLEHFPRLGPFPTLTYLNVSENKISKISVDNIAPLCRLMTLDLTKNPISFDSPNCDCQNFTAWIKQHNITVRPIFNCRSNSNLDCTGEFSNRTMSLYQECEEIIKEKIEIERARSTWILIVSCICGSLIFIFFVLYCIHRKNQKRHKKLKKAQQLAANNANTELLNSNTHEQS